MPQSGEPSCWIRQTWPLAQQIDSLNSSTAPNSVLLRLFGGLVQRVILSQPHGDCLDHNTSTDALGRNVLITEPCLPLPLHFSLLVSFSMESAPSSYNVMRNDNPSSAKYYTWWEVSSLSLLTMVKGYGGGENCRATHRHCQTICKESSIKSFDKLTLRNLLKITVSELSSSLSEWQDMLYFIFLIQRILGYNMSLIYIK